MVLEFGLIYFIGITTLRDPMTQQCVVRMQKEHAPTISQQDTQEMCLMAFEANANHLVSERQSTIRTPLFVGDNYAYWKTMMKLFIQANDYEVWRWEIKK